MLSKLVYLSILTILNYIGPSSSQFQQPGASIPKINPKVHCSIDDRFLTNVQVFHIIGVLRNNSAFKIGGTDESFNFEFFYEGNANINDAYNDYLNSLNTTNSSIVGVPSSSTWDPGFVHGITVAFEENSNRFQFTVPANGFRNYILDYDTYMTNSSQAAYLSFDMYKSRDRVLSLDEPYRCHFNVAVYSVVCVSILNNQVTIVSASMRTKQISQEIRFSLPNYLSFDRFHTYADNEGIDYILLHHRAQFIYRVDLRDYFATRDMFFKAFHLLLPEGDYEFLDFQHADNYGLVTMYQNENGDIHYYYSLFSETSGLETYCLHDKFIDGTLMVLGRRRPQPEKGVVAELRSLANFEKGEDMEVPTMLRLLFYCTIIYLTIFLGVQLIPARKIKVWRELRRLEREIQRLVPVIETLVGKVHKFLEAEKAAQKMN